MTWTKASIALFLILAHSRVCAAESSTDAATARALFSEARTLVGKGEYAAACPKFEESLRLRPGTGTRFNLADCWERVGRTASAWGQFLEAAAAAKAAGQADRESVARARAAALEAKLSRLVIDVSDADAPVLVKRNGQDVGSGTWGAAVPVDPGPQRIQAESAGKQSFATELELKPGATERVVIPKLAAVAAADGAPPAAQAGAMRSPPVATSLRDPAPTSDAGTSGGFGVQRAVGLGLAGVGLAGIGVGIVFRLKSMATNDDARKLCPTGTCTRDEIEDHGGLVDDAKSQFTVGTIGFIAGGAALAGGVVLFLTAPDRSSEHSALTVEPLVTDTAQGLLFRGVW